MDIPVVICMRKCASPERAEHVFFSECAVTISFCSGGGVSHTDNSSSSIWMTPLNARAKQDSALKLLHKTEDALHPRCFYIGLEAGDLHAL
jgi:hypothetical protein